MVRATISSPQEAPAQAFRVEAPRVSDALSLALRDAYARDLGMPEDMATLLRRLDRYGGGLTH